MWVLGLSSNAPQEQQVLLVTKQPLYLTLSYFFKGKRWIFWLWQDSKSEFKLYLTFRMFVEKL